MVNFRGNGNSIAVVAPVGGVVGGQIFRQGNFVGVAVADAAEGQSFTLKITGEYSDVKKKPAQAWAIGDQLYCSAANELSNVNTDGVFSGWASEAALAADVVGSIILK